MFLLFSSPEGSESITRESVVSGLTSVSNTVPIARFSEEEKRVSVIKAPHYEGIGPVDESGIPIAIRTVSCPVKMITEPVTYLPTSPTLAFFVKVHVKRIRRVEAERELAKGENNIRTEGNRLLLVEQTNIFVATLFGNHGMKW